MKSGSSPPADAPSPHPSAIVDNRPSMAAAATEEGKINGLDKALHASAHREGKRYSFMMEEPPILISEEDDDDDIAGGASSMGAASFCDASLNSEADERYLRRGMSFSTDGNLIDFIDYHRQEITGGVDDIDDSKELTPDMIADQAIRRAQEGGYDDLSEDELEAEINRQLEEEDALRKSKAARKKAGVEPVVLDSSTAKV